MQSVRVFCEGVPDKLVRRGGTERMLLMRHEETQQNAKETNWGQLDGALLSSM